MLTAKSPTLTADMDAAKAFLEFVSKVSTQAIFIKTNTTIRTLAASSGMAESDVASATYTIDDAPPAGTPLDPWCVTTRWPRRQGDNKCRQDWPPLSSSPES